MSLRYRFKPLSKEGFSPRKQIIRKSTSNVTYQREYLVEVFRTKKKTDFGGGVGATSVNPYYMRASYTHI